MAITVSLGEGAQGVSSVANQAMNFTITVANSNATSVVLQSLSIVESTESDAIVSQPVFMTPNTPVGVGNPIIPAGASVTYGFQAVFTNPVLPGPSPQAPGGASPINTAYYSDPNFILMGTAFTSDGSVSSGTLQVPVLSATFPQSNGGALVLSQGFNLINFVML